MNHDLKASVVCDADHEEEEDDDVDEDDEEEEEEDIEFEDETDVDVEEEEEEDDDDDEEEEEEEETDDEVEQEEEEDEEEEEEDEVEFEENEDKDMGEEESEDKAEEEEEDEELTATFAGPNNPNFMTLHEYRGKGYGTVRYTPKGGTSIEFDMYNKKDFETVRNLIKNPPKGTTWRVLRYDISQPKKTQKSGRSHAPGFRTPSDDDSSAKAGSVNVDKTIKGYGRKVASRENVNDGKAAFEVGTTRAKFSKKVQRTAKKAVAPNSTQKPSAKTNQKTAKKASAKSKVSGSKKGKIVITQRNDSDVDSLDLDNVEGLREAMAKIQKDDRPKKPLVISVSPPLANVADGCIKYVCSFSRPGKIFYAKAAWFKMVIAMVYKKRKLLNPDEDSTWIQTISSFNLRSKEFGEASIWLKTTSGNTIDVMYFVLSVPIGEEHAFLPMLKAQIKYFFDVTRKRKTNATGRLVLDYCLDLPQGRKGGLGGYCLNKGTTKKGTPQEVVSEAKAADVMTEELDEHFRDGYTLNYDVPLNKFMVDWDIKEFVKTYIGVNSWDDLVEEDKRKCYRDYPKKSLPDWDEIAQESY